MRRRFTHSRPRILRREPESAVGSHHFEMNTLVGPEYPIPPHWPQGVTVGTGLVVVVILGVVVVVVGVVVVIVDSGIRH